MTNDLTRILRVDPQKIDQAAIAEAANLLRNGQVVAFPTETVYGLGANATNPAAVARIFAAKGRPANDPLIVHIDSLYRLPQVVRTVPDAAQPLISRFWPGPLTLVLERSAEIASAVSAGLPTVAVRMPAHPIALALLSACRLPICAPSANLFSHSSPTTAQHVYDDLARRIPLIIDGGPTIIGVESTIVDLSTNQPRLLRPGGIALETLREYLPDLDIVSRYAVPEEDTAPAPGMLLKHYSPRAEMRLFEGTDESIREAIAHTAIQAGRRGQRVGLLVADEDRAALSDIPGIVLFSLGSLTDLEQVAQRLFAGLRALDSAEVDLILARAFPAQGIGLAVWDRMLRAAEGRIIHA